MLRKVTIPAVIVALSLTLAIWMFMQQPAPAMKLPDPPVLLVSVVKAEPTSVNFKVTAQGTVSPRTQTTLVSEVSGQIVEVSDDFVSGGFFKKGDVLVHIDDRNYRAELKRAEAAVASARTAIAQEQGLAEFASRTETARREGSATELALRRPQIAEAEAQLEFALADLDKKRGDLQRTTIRAPYDGMIRSKIADVGQFISAGSQLAEVFAVDFVEVRLPLPDRELPYLDLDDNPAVTLSAELGGEAFTWTGNILRTEGVFDENSRVLYVVAQVTDPYNRLDQRWAYPLRVGTFVEASIEGYRVDDVVVLPRSVVRRGDQVWVIGEHNELTPKTVDVLRADENYVYVSGGLEEFPLVCLTNLENPLPGTVVRFDPPFDPHAESELTLPLAERSGSNQVEPGR